MIKAIMAVDEKGGISKGKKHAMAKKLNRSKVV